MNSFRFFLLLFFVVFISTQSMGKVISVPHELQDSTVFDRDYVLESTMLGYFGLDGTRNPVLRANKGDRVRITITNGELMAHDIAMEKMGVKSDVIVDKGASTFIVFTAESSDTYYCTIPGHRAAGMVGKFEIVEGDVDGGLTITGEDPQKDGRRLNLGFEGGTLEN